MYLPVAVNMRDEHGSSRLRTEEIRKILSQYFVVPKFKTNWEWVLNHVACYSNGTSLNKYYVSTADIII